MLDLTPSTKETEGFTKAVKRCQSIPDIIDSLDEYSPDFKRLFFKRFYGEEPALLWLDFRRDFPDYSDQQALLLLLYPDRPPVAKAAIIGSILLSGDQRLIDLLNRTLAEGKYLEETSMVRFLLGLEDFPDSLAGATSNQVLEFRIRLASSIRSGAIDVLKVALAFEHLKGWTRRITEVYSHYRMKSAGLALDADEEKLNALIELNVRERACRDYSPLGKLFLDHGGVSFQKDIFERVSSYYVKQFYGFFKLGLISSANKAAETLFNFLGDERFEPDERCRLDWQGALESLFSGYTARPKPQERWLTLSESSLEILFYFFYQHPLLNFFSKPVSELARECVKKPTLALTLPVSLREAVFECICSLSAVRRARLQLTYAFAFRTSSNFILKKRQQLEKDQPNGFWLDWSKKYDVLHRFAWSELLNRAKEDERIKNKFLIEVIGTPYFKRINPRHIFEDPLKAAAELYAAQESVSQETWVKENMLAFLARGDLDKPLDELEKKVFAVVVKNNLQTLLLKQAILKDHPNPKESREIFLRYMVRNADFNDQLPCAPQKTKIALTDVLVRIITSEASRPAQKKRALEAWGLLPLPLKTAKLDELLGRLFDNTFEQKHLITLYGQKDKKIRPLSDPIRFITQFDIPIKEAAAEILRQKKGIVGINPYLFLLDMGNFYYAKALDQCFDWISRAREWDQWWFNPDETHLKARARFVDFVLTKAIYTSYFIEQAFGIRQIRRLPRYLLYKNPAAACAKYLLFEDVPIAICEPRQVFFDFIVSYLEKKAEKKRASVEEKKIFQRYLELRFSKERVLGGHPLPERNSPLGHLFEHYFNQGSTIHAQWFERLVPTISELINKPENKTDKFRDEVISSLMHWMPQPQKLSGFCRYRLAALQLLNILRYGNCVNLKKVLFHLTKAAKDRCASGRALDGCYHLWSLPKKSGGNRTISAPSAPLKAIQRAILARLIVPLGAHPAAHGFIKDHSIVTNAIAHVGHRVLANADISQCFPSVSWKRVLGVLRRDLGQRLLPETINMICAICTSQGGLPTGAPTSPALLNRVLLEVDRILSAVAAKKGCIYTRYADDLSFSSDDHAAVDMLAVASDVLHTKVGLKLDPKKTNIFRRGRRQSCTGLVVNERVSVPRKIRRDLRAAVHAVENGKLPTWHGQPESLDALRGRLCYLKMVHPEEAQVLFERLDKATGKSNG